MKCSVKKLPVVTEIVMLKKGEAVQQKEVQMVIPTTKNFLVGDSIVNGFQEKGFPRNTTSEYADNKGFG